MVIYAGEDAKNCLLASWPVPDGSTVHRHSGHVEREDSHKSMQSQWYTWLHAGSSFTMAPTWITPRQTAHSVQLSPLPLCLTNRSYMNGGRPAAAAESGRSSSETSASVRRCARCLYSEKRAKAAATDAVTEQKKRRLSGDIAKCIATDWAVLKGRHQSLRLNWKRSIYSIWLRTRAHFFYQPAEMACTDNSVGMTVW